MKPGFIYIWHDTKRNKFYIGSHYGHTNDGYVGSNKRLMSAYKSRPDSFKRRILEYYEIADKSNLIVRENYWLSMISDDELRVKYYNEKKVAAGGDIVSTLSDKKKKEHKLKSNSIIRQLREDNPSWSLDKCAQVYYNMLEHREQNKKKPGETWTGRQHSLESKKKMSLSAIERGYCREPEWVHSEKTKRLVGLNNPKRKSIYTPYGKYTSAEEFAKITNKITANGIRGLLNDCDKIITKRRAERSPLLTLEDVGKTPRELGYFYGND